MRAASLSLFMLLTISGATFAGRNDGGSLIVHANDAYNYTHTDVCDPPAGVLPETCDGAMTTSTRDSGAVLWVLAAFHPEADPQVVVVYFGIDYDDVNLAPVDYRVCGPGGTFTIEDPGWPYTGRGISVAFGSPVEDDYLFPVYIFVMDGGTAGSYFETTINPTGGYACFADEDIGVGSELDPITRFGTVRWNEPGQKACPDPPRPGGCCLPSGECVQVMSMHQCLMDLTGVWLGAGVECDPNPCAACCFWKDEGGGVYSRSCVVTSEADCATNPRWGATIEVDGHVVGPDWSAPGWACVPGDPEQVWYCEDPRLVDYRACCIGEDLCRWLSEDQCGKLGGVFTDAMFCEDAPCGAGRGACCMPDGDCRLETESACEVLGGSFQGEEVPCDPNPCTAVPTRSTTWGEIRSLFR